MCGKEIGKMHTVLNELGRRGVKAREGTKVTVSEFKESFQRVSCERYEVDPGVIEEVVRRACDLRGTAEAVLGTMTIVKAFHTQKYVRPWNLLVVELY